MIKIFNRIYTYTRVAAKAFLSKPTIKIIISSVIYFPAWWKYLNPTRNSIGDQTPWFNFSAIRFLKKIIHQDMVGYEWGSGGSTLFWSNNIKRVISIEHDKEWFTKINQIIKNDNRNNIDYKLIEPQTDKSYDLNKISNSENYFSEDYLKMNFRNYSSDIDQYPDNYFDIILVDGRARPSCLHHAMKKVKTNGYLIIDNSERKHYQDTLKLFKKAEWKRTNFYGPIPYTFGFFSTTTFYQRKHT